MDRLRALFKRYREPISYLFFGGLTTLVNMGVYALLVTAAHVRNVPATVVAWAASVLFAFLTNKAWVFDSRDWSAKVVLREAGAFFPCRALTGLLDLGIMYVAVDLLQFNELLMKALSNIIVIVLNYVASRLMIFRKR